MNILMIGDVVAKPGRLAVLERIQDLREQYKIDLAVMNAENLAGGFSVTPSLCEQLFVGHTLFQNGRSNNELESAANRKAIVLSVSNSFIVGRIDDVHTKAAAH